MKSIPIKLGLAALSLLLSFMAVWSVLSVVLLLNIRSKAIAETKNNVLAGSPIMLLRPNGLWSMPTGMSGTNEDGFRLRGYTKEKPAGEYRIAVLGGSAIYGVMLPPLNSVPRTLQTIYSEHGRANVRVLNFGMSAFTSTNELILLATYVLDWNPDMVIVVDGWNDGASKYLPPHMGYFTVIYKAVLDQANLHVSMYSMSVKQTFDSSPIGRFLIPVLIPHSDDRNMQVRAAAMDVARPMRTAIDYSIPTYTSNLKAMDGILNSFNLPHFFVIQPINKHSGEQSSERSNVESFPKLEAAFKDVCGHLSATCYDAASAVPPDNNHFQDVVHMTAKGTRVMAEVLYRVVNQQ